MGGFLRGLLDRVVLVAAILGGGCVPSFIAQYRQRLGGRLDQVIQDLAPFKAIAARDFAGNLEALIRHHAESGDATFRHEAAAIQQLVDAQAKLSAAMRALDADLFTQFAWLLRHVDMELARATWAAWQPAFDFTLEGLRFAVLVGILFWAAFLVVWYAAETSLRPLAKP
ncbi:MAG TPA: DUF2937 family protein [Burkholderiaceae bacterium]|nr:DUF2937 family protein [Burkholderiaceae bacterium]